MDPQTDITRRKPRQTKGTPSLQYRNRFAAGCIVLGTLIFAAFSFTPVFRVANKKLLADFCTETEEERDRKYMFSRVGPAPRRGEFIQQTMEEKKELEIKQ